MIDGILLIDKEVGITSYDVIRKLKKILPKNQKIGHAGTLDPFASGLLIILLGKSTKLMKKILQFEKEYIIKAEFGYATDTHDITGKKVKTSKSMKVISRENLEFAINSSFIGKILQTPPLFSAKKINGRKAYEYARRGEAVKLQPKKVTVKSFDIVEYNWPYAVFNIVCTSGTYIRTLINDLGEMVNVYGTAIELKRVRVGKFNLEDSMNSVDIIKGVKLNLITFENE